MQANDMRNSDGFHKVNDVIYFIDITLCYLPL